MSDMLSVAVSGLRAFQRALETTSHNIANVSTDGYSRQTVQLTTNTPQIYGSSSVGTGVSVTGITRASDALLTAQMWRASSSYSRLEAYSDKADALNNLFGDSSTGISAQLTTFSNALQDVANDPSSSSARQVLLSQANSLVTRLQTYDSRLDDINTQINDQLRSEATNITSIAKNIAQLNQQIATASATTGSAPNDLLDARDEQLTELASHVDISTTVQDDGQVNVFIGNGQALVLGGNSSTIVAQTDPLQTDHVTLAVKSTNGTMDITSALSGGTVGGLLDVRREMLDPARNQLGQIAVALSDVINSQHAEGVDLYGAAGGDLFAVGGVGVQPATTNTGAATIAATRTDSSQLTAFDYVLSYDGTAWSMKRADTGEAVAITGTGTATDPIVGAGVSIVVSGTPSAGDRFMVKPTADAVSGMSVLISDPSRIAAAAPIVTSAATANTGSGAISAGEVLDASNPALQSGVTLQFTDATHYTINGAGSYTYTSGSNIDVNGWRVQITGAPAAGDTFTVSANTSGSGDNRNALAMVDALSRGVLSGGTVSVQSAATSFVGTIGVATSQASSSLSAQQVIYDDTVSAVQSKSGVNLDEEAADMLRYQQAYQAAAQMISVAQTLFETLLDATHR